MMEIAQVTVLQLEELAAAYCMLANLGEYRQLEMRKVASPKKPKRLLSRPVCLQLYQMLEQPLLDRMLAQIVQPLRPFLR